MSAAESHVRLRPQAAVRIVAAMYLIAVATAGSTAQNNAHGSWLINPTQLLDLYIETAPTDQAQLGPSLDTESESALDDAAMPELMNDEPRPPLTDRERIDKLETEIAKLQADDVKPPNKYPEAPTAIFTMELQADAYTFGQDETNLATVGNIPEGTAFRRARVGWFGEWELTEYRIEFDIAQAGRPTFLDVWAGLTEVPIFNRVHVGHFFEPFSLERMTSNRFGTFLERSLLDSFFVPARNMGVAVSNYSENERFAWALGLFAEDSDNFGDDVGFERGEAFTGRITCLPYWCDDGRHYVHLGAAGSLRNPNEDEVRYATQPEARLGAASPNVPFFVDTGTFSAEHEMRGGLEFAWIYGPFSIQSEYMCASADRIGGPDVFFDGWYVETSLFLTGEHRPYQRTAFGGGALGRVIPYHNVCLASRSGSHGCGWGAWEVAARVSHLNGNDADILGRELTDVTFGTNWYLTPYLRIMSNYIHAFLDDPALDESDADIFGLRIQYDF